jgi:hypothetical protein
MGLLEELQALGVAFVSLAEGIDATTPAGKLQMHILGAIADSNGNASGNGSWLACNALGGKEKGSVDRELQWRSNAFRVSVECRSTKRRSSSECRGRR